MKLKRVISAFAVSGAALLSAVPALATDGGSSAAAGMATGMTSIIGQTDTVITMSEEIFNLLSGNPYTASFMAVGLLGVGFTVFRRSKYTARH